MKVSQAAFGKGHENTMTRAIVAAVLLFMLTPAVADDPPMTRSDVEAIIEDYLTRNPEIVIRALEAWERLREEREADAARQAIARFDDDIHHDPETPWGGDPDGDVVIVEFFDYRCGYCRMSAPGLFAVRDTVPGAKVIYKEFPILGEDSLRAAKAALAAREQGLYEAYHRALMLETEDYSEAGLMALAQSVGLDTGRLSADMKDPSIEAYLERTHQLASALGINGTPAFIINGELYPGAIRPGDFEIILGIE